jgi:hypothetical protein
LTKEEQEQLRTFLNAHPKVTQRGKYLFELDGREVDFTPASTLPESAKDWAAIQAEVLGWLGNMPLALRIDKRLADRRFRKRREGLG